jgi:site-specific DNA-methyltransferase (adenine-specific)
VRDAIIKALKDEGGEATIAEVRRSVNSAIGDVPESSVRSYLRLNTPKMFTLTGRGRYKLARRS